MIYIIKIYNEKIINSNIEPFPKYNPTTQQ